MPDVYKELFAIQHRLEEYFTDMQDIEFSLTAEKDAADVWTIYREQKHLMGTPESEHINDEYLVGHGEATLEIFRYPFRIDAFMIGICTGGEAILRTFLVSQYGQWREYKVMDKTALRKILYGRIDRIVELDKRHPK